MPSRGAALIAPDHEIGPEQAKAEFWRRIADLYPEGALDEDEVIGLYTEFCAILGGWLSTIGAPEKLPVLRRLASSARFLDRLGGRLAGVQTGDRKGEDIEFAIRIREALALSPAVGDLSQADKKLASFQQECLQMAQAIRDAFKTLKSDRGEPGPAPLEWYDRFTSLLLKLAESTGATPTLRKDRAADEWKGWLMDAATSFEEMLYRPMQSPSSEARGKRLQRSLSRLKSPR